MPIKFVGEIESVHRVVTGFTSLDLAFAGIDGEVGLPLGIMELFGPTHCGKSTLSYALIGTVARIEGKKFILADVEGFDPDHVIHCLETVHYDGDVLNITDESDEVILDEIIAGLRRPDVIGSLFDSIGGVSPVSEVKEVHGAANMGRRAKLMAQHMRKNVHDRRKPDSKRLSIYTNHKLALLGKVPGSTTPGGDTLKYLAAMRVFIYRGEVFPKKIDDGEDYVAYTIKGVVKKNRFGYRERKFEVFVISGLGVHPGMTDLWDCINFGLVKRGKQLTVDGKSIGFLKKYIEYAKTGDETQFVQFRELLDKMDKHQAIAILEPKQELVELSLDGDDELSEDVELTDVDLSDE